MGRVLQRRLKVSATRRWALFVFWAIIVHQLSLPVVLSSGGVERHPSQMEIDDNFD